MLSISLLIFGLLLSLISLLGILSKYKTKRNIFSSKKLIKYSAIISIILLSSSSLLAIFTSEQHSYARESTVKQQKIQKNKTNTSKKIHTISDNEAQTKKINSAIAKSLKEDQNDAKDPNNPLKSDWRYSSTDKIESIEYLGDKKIIVNVSNKFNSLNNDQKKLVIDYDQDCAFSGKVLDAGEVSGEEREQGLYAFVKYGKYILGHSTYSNYKQYKWYDTTQE